MTSQEAAILALTVLEPFTQSSLYYDYQDEDKFDDDEYAEMLTELRKLAKPLPLSELVGKQALLKFHDSPGRYEKVGSYIVIAASPSGEWFHLRNTQAHEFWKRVTDFEVLEIFGEATAVVASAAFTVRTMVSNGCKLPMLSVPTSLRGQMVNVAVTLTK